jgi:hypothetical protein
METVLENNLPASKMAEGKPNRTKNTELRGLVDKV